jgi:hypothetical protein
VEYWSVEWPRREDTARIAKIRANDATRYDERSPIGFTITLLFRFTLLFSATRAKPSEA